jgi:hypothetical protein
MAYLVTEFTISVLCRRTLRHVVTGDEQRQWAQRSRRLSLYYVVAESNDRAARSQLPDSSVGNGADRAPDHGT